MTASVFDLERSRLRARARRLAERRSDDSGPRAEREAVVLFRLHGETFGLRAREIAGVAPLAKLTAVPGTAPELLGVMAHAGEVTAIFDLARLLALPGDGAAGFVLLVKGTPVGLLLEHVETIVEIDASTDANPRPLITRDGGGRFTLITDLDVLLRPFLHGDGR